MIDEYLAAVFGSSFYYEDDCVINFGHQRIEGKEWIYALYNTLGVCLYVGRTIDFRHRWNSHNNRNGRRLSGVGEQKIIMLPLELVNSSIANERERFHQRSFEKIGMAQHSRRFWHRGPRKKKVAQNLPLIPA